MTFALYESWRRAHILREQLSAEDIVTSSSLGSTAYEEQTSNAPTEVRTPDPTDELCLSSLKTWTGNDVSTVYSEDHTQSEAVSESMEAKSACLKDDVLHRGWQIKFINGQMLLKGTETKGYVILSSSKAEATKRVHAPVWKDQALLSKSSWSGSLEGMQYFATVAEVKNTN